MDDEMDYVMHHPQDNALSPQQPQLHQHHNHQTQQQQLRQCPYWSDHQLSGFPPHYGPGLQPPPPPHNHSSNHSPHNSQGSQNQGLAPLNNRSQASHPYDPVHSSIPALNNNWYPGTPSYHWSPVTLPHPRPSLDTFYPYSSHSSAAGPGSAGTPGNNNSTGSRGVGGLDPSSTSGPVQPPVVQNQQTPRHEPFNPFPIAFHHQSASLHRFSAVPPVMSAPNQTPQSGQQAGQQLTSFPPASSEFSGIRLPALSPPVLPRPTQTPQQQPQQEGATSSNGNMTTPSDNLSHPDPGMLPTRAARGLPEPPRTRNILDGSPRNPEMPQVAGSTAVPDGASVASPPSVSNSENRRRLLNMRMRQASTRRSDSSDYDSEEDAAEAEHERALELLEQLAGPGVVPLRGEDMTEARIRAHQLLRGQMSTKRVASKTALASLQSVDIATLPESEKTCIICYNDFGVENPEGINEAPLRLPRCKHVFGDHCIKKWFEESDSCPYCRDKVPSEPQFKAGGQALREYLSRSAVMPVPRATLRALSMEQSSASAFAMLRDSTGDASRYVRAPAAGADASPTRAWQTGERRSPPTEAQENRRRTRARHGSLRAFTSASSGTAATGQPASYALAGPSASQHQHRQSPGRDRVNPPNLPPQWLPYAHDARRSLTSLMARQFPSSSFRPQSHYNSQDSIWQTNYQRQASMMTEPLGPNPPSAPNQQPFQNYVPAPSFAVPQQGHQDQSASTGGSGVPSGQPPQPFPGPSSMMGLAFGSGPDGFGYSPHGGTQNNQANNNRIEAFGFPNAQNNNQRNAIPNREGNW